MGDKTGISWTDATWNPIRGCSRVSEGCRHCYAEVQAARIVRMGKGKPTAYDGLVKLAKIPPTHASPTAVAEEPAWIENHGGDGRSFAFGTEARWTGKVLLDAATLAKPLRWRKPRRIFVNSMSDLFHERLTNEEIAAVFGVMAAAHWHTHQVLTKRMRRARKWFAWLDEMIEHDAELRSGADCSLSIDEARDVARTALLAKHAASALDGIGEHNATWWEQALLDYMSRGQPRASWEVTAVAWPLPNVWIGVSVENQAAADERIPELLAAPAAVRFLSCEPLLSGIEIRHWLDLCHKCHVLEAPTLEARHAAEHGKALHWVIAGCESGPGARSCDVAWFRSLRDQCRAAGVPYFLKQAVELRPDTGDGPLMADDGSKRKPGGVIDLPYLDGKQHAAFPTNSAAPSVGADLELARNK